MQEYDNEAEQAICDVGIHYTDTPLDIGEYLVVHFGTSYFALLFVSRIIQLLVIGVGFWTETYCLRKHYFSEHCRKCSSSYTLFCTGLC